MRSQMKIQIEELTKGIARKIKEIEESPGPAGVRFDKLSLELEKGKWDTMLDAQQRGKPIIEGPPCRRLFRAMGLVPSDYGNMPSYAGAAEESFGECSQIAKGMGFPADQCCDKIPVQLAALSNSAWPKPELMVLDSHTCDIDHVYYARGIADLLNIPAFFIDFPLYQGDKPTLANLNYIADQFGEFIEWAESKIPGVKYDEAGHIEALEMDAAAQKYQSEVYQLIKHVPCPVSPHEALSMGFFSRRLPSNYPNTQKVAEYIRLWRDELGERVARGTGPYPEERLRLLWAGQIHGKGNLSPTKLLLERKVALPIAATGWRRPMFSSLSGAFIGDVSRYGLKLSPLQEEAADLSMDWWSGPGKRWVNHILDLACDIGAHGIIHFQLIGCTPMNSMGSVVANRADKELGIPTLNFVGRYLDKEFMSQEQFEEVLLPFIDKCFDWVGKPRQ